MIKNMFNKFPEIETENYILRKLKISDYNEIFKIYSDKEVLKYQCMNVLHNSEEAKEYIQKILAGYENKLFIRWGITSKADDKILGLIACHHIDYADKSAKLGYILNREYWSRGIMTHCLKSTIDYLVKNTEIENLELQIHPDNKASIILAEKMGFRYMRTMNKSALNPTTNHYEDRIVMALHLT